MAKVEIEEAELEKYRQVFTAIRQCLSIPRARELIIQAQAILGETRGFAKPRSSDDVLAIVREMAREGY
jgi:hypothetical protein